MEYRLKASGASALFTDPESLEKIRDILPNLPQLKTIVVAEEDEDRQAKRAHSVANNVDLLWFDDVISNSSVQYPVTDTSADDPGVIIFTSGKKETSNGNVPFHLIENLFGCRNYWPS